MEVSNTCGKGVRDLIEKLPSMESLMLEAVIDEMTADPTRAAVRAKLADKMRNTFAGLERKGVEPGQALDAMMKMLNVGGSPRDVEKGAQRSAGRACRRRNCALRARPQFSADSMSCVGSSG